MNSSHSTSTSSSGSSTSSGSSSCTDSGSSSTDSDSTTSSDAKPLNSSRTNDSKTKQQVVTRRKSSESKANQQKPNVDSEKATSKNCSANGTTGQKQLTKAFAYSSDDDTPPTKKPLKRLSTSSNAQTSQRRRSSGPFALTASKLQKTQSDSATTAASTAIPDVKITKGSQGTEKDKQAPSLTSADAEDTVKPSSVSSPVKKLKHETVKPTLRPSNANSVSESASAKVKSSQTKRNSATTQPIRAAAVATTSTRKKCSDDSEYDSISGTEDETSSSSSETDSSENSSYNSKTEKGQGGGVGAKRRPKNRLAETGVKNKNELFDSEEGQSPTKNTRNRKLTRSLSTRRNSKQQIKTSAGASQQGMGSETDSEPINGTSDVKRSLCKSPAKKSYIGFGASGLSKCSVKKEISNNGFTNMSRAPTPPQLEKRCPVDGCDSSGHLSGNLDRHFLPEACPIYHNMSVSECKERANERKLRSESLNKTSINSNHLDNQKINTQSSAKHQQTIEQKEFYSKFKESRARFKPMTEVVNCDKVKLEKDCNDEDREPNLIGLVPDYDLQLFRDAQALASEKIEEEVKDLPIGKGIK